MTYLKWELEGDADIDPEAPLGRLEVIGDQGRIEDTNLMLDTFLEAMIDGLSRIQELKEARIDTTDEPFDLVFRRAPGGLEIGYGQQLTLIRDVDALRGEVTAAVAGLLKTLDRAAARQRRGHPPRYPKLRKYLARMSRDDAGR